MKTTRLRAAGGGWGGVDNRKGFCGIIRPIMPKAGKRKKKKGGKVQRRTTASARVRKPAAAESDANGGARLIFPHSFQEEGFTSADISQFDNKDIPSAVRELIQNSLDAAMEIPRRPAVVRFSVERHPLKSIPGLPEYKAAFQSASVRSRFGGQEADIIADIEKGLQSETVPFLFVEDNGVGLNPRRMDALNGDGVNVKGGKQAIGSYGNGHLTVFCLSQLRYILYGGVTANGDMTASGHAILASHSGKDKMRASKHGFYAVELSGKVDANNVYPQNGDIAPFLQKRLDAIRSECDSGSMVAIPGFNFFGADNAGAIAEDIKKAAALNFFPAIHEGNLEVQISENNEKSSLTKANLSAYIDGQADKGGGRAGFPTGAKSAASYRSLLEGSEHSVAFDNGDIRLLLRQGAEHGIERTRVTFCRNGMWITDQVGMLAKTHFAEKVPFDALLLADVDGCKKFHDLMTKAEGRLHIDLDVRRLNKVADRTALRAAFQAVREFLLKEIADSENEMFSPSNFYQIEVGQAAGGGKDSSIVRGQAKPVPGTFAHAAAAKKKSKGKKSAQQKRRSGNTVIVRTMAKRVDADTMEVGVGFQEDCDNCELQMTLDNGTDPSCERPLGKKQLYIRSAKAGNGNLELTGGANKFGINLGSAKAGDRRIVRVQFEAGQLREDSLHALSCKLYRRAAGRASEGEEAQ